MRRCLLVLLLFATEVATAVAVDAHADGCGTWGCSQVEYLEWWLTAVGGSNG